MITITIDSARRATLSGRLYSNETARVKLSGVTGDATKLRLYVVNPAGIVSAYTAAFNSDYEADVNLNTTVMAADLQKLPDGRATRRAVVVTDQTATVGSGFADIVKAPQIAAPIDLSAATIAQIQALLNEAAEADEPENDYEAWKRSTKLAADLAHTLGA